MTNYNTKQVHKRMNKLCHYDELNDPQGDHINTNFYNAATQFIRKLTKELQIYNLAYNRQIDAEQIYRVNLVHKGQGSITLGSVIRKNNRPTLSFHIDESYYLMTIIENP